MNNMMEVEKNEVLKIRCIDRQLYVGLISNNKEITSASYIRVPVKFTNPIKGQIYNSEDVTFPIANENWGEVTEIGIYDSKTGGNCTWKGKAEVVKNIGIASQYKIPKNYLILRLR